MLFRAGLRIALLFFVALTPSIASAQQASATVRGVVADPENAVIPGATVTLTPASGKALITAVQETPASEYLVTDSDGKLAGVLASADLMAALRALGIR